MQQVSTPNVIKKILRMKQRQPSLFAWEIREKLVKEGVCDTRSLPSVSSVNRILRGSGLQTENFVSGSSCMTNGKTINIIECNKFGGNPSILLYK